MNNCKSIQGSGLTGRAVSILLLSLPLLALAQDGVPVTQLLFEPVPIPVGGLAEDGTAFLSYENLPQLTPEQAGIDDGPSAEEKREKEQAISGYVTRIGDKEAAEGPYEEQLTQDLLAVGILYQELDDHESALGFFDRAMNISRINHGPDSLDQLPIMRAKADSHYALGQLKLADEIQDSILYLQQQVYGQDSAETAPALLALGDWNLKAFLERSNIALNIHRMNVPNFLAATQYNSLDNTASGSPVLGDIQNPQDTPLYNLYLAQRNYLGGIDLMLKAKDYSNPMLLQLERQLLTTAFLRTHQENIVYEPDFYLSRKTTATGTRLDTSTQNLLQSDDYEVGQKSLERSLSYISANEARTAAQVATALLEQADWDQLFKRPKQAREKYEAAYAFFEQYPDMTATITDIVYPDVPVVLPTFLPAANSRARLGIAPDEDVNYFGYFDVSFEITRDGKTRKVKFNGQGGEVTKVMEIRLGQYLRNLQFRPRYKAGKLDTSALNLRYYVGY
jgi:tetratricopeptide (TPR) repeat protein